MINTQLIKKFSAGFLLAVSSVASAQDYPAADFQPKVLYRDPAITELSQASSPAVTSNTGTPCVQKQEAAEVDAKYPAANFQPKVLFSAAGS
ncbi:MAG: hypothetical protein BVN35_22190 [Proteobacteria bacterium ST_bin11]|nr:MAG: hypothetical protein BVN35_22190 [Proteobacteria bacterium ST_bin11]